MAGSNAWAEFAGLYRSTRDAFLDHERAKSELKALTPEDGKWGKSSGLRTGAKIVGMIQAADGELGR
jgi:hypothetical protein